MDASKNMELVGDPEQLRQALTPIRRDLLQRLRTPASAVELAHDLDLPRQKIGYHLRQLEDAGLIELVETRRRRGFTERVLKATATAYVIDPDILTPATTPAPPTDNARHAADHLVAVASNAVRDVVRMQTNADKTGTRLLTYTLESEIRFADPDDVHRFTEALAAATAAVIEQFDSPTGRQFRIVAAGYPTPRTKD
ncbi:ArsR/SmtB family transcription factor [Antrihabitans sp. NCIMB 15449]|uniref:ArsR/SmtB family transcription factor n=1 Tax=Antrihabitans spumae TaxID=3373370 RepID=A0ABW7JU12_9NOCA